tara:strand:- start:151 stop:459 length:309 start_codon:yes stop_codon:yes gene_type:complete
MVSKEIIIHTIFKAVNEINKRLSKKQQLIKSISTILSGSDDKLDSLGLVNLIVAIEQNIEDEFEVSITIADERAMSQKHSPFKTVGSLADYIEMLLNEELND